MRTTVPNSRIALSFAVTVVSFLFSCHLANAEEFVRAGIYEYGIYVTSPVIGADPPSEYGFKHEYVETAENIEKTQIVPGRVGLQFGVRFFVHTAFSGTPVWLRIVVRFPPQGLYDLEKGEPAYMDEWLLERISGEDQFYLWPFEEQWHVEPGIWAIEIWHDGKKLCEQKFEVVTPPIS